MPTEMELTLEQTQQGVSYEVSVLSDIEDSHGPSDAMHNPLPATQITSTVHSYRASPALRRSRYREHAEYDESNTYVSKGYENGWWRFLILAGSIRSINHMLNTHRQTKSHQKAQVHVSRLPHSRYHTSTRIYKVFKVKEFQEEATFKAFKNVMPFRIPEVTSPQLPTTEIYALVSQHRVAKDLWEKIKLLMQGTSLTKQERECKLYDEFDKFTYKKGETLHEYYLSCISLVNSASLSISSTPSPTVSISTTRFTISVFSVSYTLSTSSTTQHLFQLEICSPQPNNPRPPTPTQNPPEFSQPDSSLVVPVFQKGDDPIDAINHMMSFLTAVVTSRYPTTNNQLRTSSNPRQQATIYDGKVTVQPVQGRHTSYAAGTTRKYTPGASGSNTGKPRTVICYNCKGEGHIAKQCTKPKRKRDETWFNDKVLLVQAQAGVGGGHSSLTICLTSRRSLMHMSRDCDETPISQNCSHGILLKEWTQMQSLSQKLDKSVIAISIPYFSVH
ncbi:integrase, catalytic region, zinc finger, CCHC-type containing protein [Tanacetum coccineum]|uniref:Integrase, catalytic region, zinc finger, CCHC-type containing protein n=1 Tax=Tanacetum coccineum TaxID=301880 RepID=A0ABQ5DYJ1_9ASTR